MVRTCRWAVEIEKHPHPPETSNCSVCEQGVLSKLHWACISARRPDNVQRMLRLTGNPGLVFYVPHVDVVRAKGDMH